MNVKCHFCDTQEKDIKTLPEGWFSFRLRTKEQSQTDPTKPIEVFYPYPVFNVSNYITIAICPEHNKQLKEIFGERKGE